MGLLFFSQSCFLSSAKRVNNIRQVTVLMTVIFWVKKKKSHYIEEKMLCDGKELSQVLDSKCGVGRFLASFSGNDEKTKEDTNEK